MIRISCARRRGSFPAKSQSASTPATDASRSRAGPRPPTCPRSNSGAAFEDAGVAAIIYTDITRDGALAGLNIESTVALAEALTIPVIASGGLASIDDIRRLTEPDCARLAGAIVGRALYDGRLDPRAALALLRGAGFREPAGAIP